MQHLDSDYVERLLSRLASIPDDAEPRWGCLRKQGLIHHLVWIVRHSMGRSRDVPFLGNWFTRNVVGPVYLSGWCPTPKNLRFRGSTATCRDQGDLETLHALLDEYLALVQADELKTGIHPLFGDIGVDGWDRLHVRHFEYHCRQFGV